MVKTDHHWDPRSQLLPWRGTLSLPSPAPIIKFERSLPARTSHHSVSEHATWLWSVPGWTEFAAGTCPWSPPPSLRCRPGCQSLRGEGGDGHEREGKDKKSKPDELKKITKERRQRQWQWKGDRRERETDDKQIRYSHPLMLFREVTKRVLCFWVFFSTDHYSASMCEMNLWLKDLNKHILAYWDGLATIVVRYAYMNGYMRVCASRPFPFKCRSLRL